MGLRAFCGPIADRGPIGLVIIILALAGPVLLLTGGIMFSVHAPHLAVEGNARPSDGGEWTLNDPQVLITRFSLILWVGLGCFVGGWLPLCCSWACRGCPTSDDDL